MGLPLVGVSHREHLQQRDAVRVHVALLVVRAVQHCATAGESTNGQKRRRRYRDDSTFGSHVSGSAVRVCLELLVFPLQQLRKPKVRHLYGELLVHQQVARLRQSEQRS